MNVVYIYVFLLRQWKRVGIFRENSRPIATTSYGVWNTNQIASMEETKLTVQTAGDTKAFHTQQSITGNTVDDVINEHNDNGLKGGGENCSKDMKSGIMKTWKNVSYDGVSGNKANGSAMAREINDNGQKGDIKGMPKIKTET